MKKTIIIGLLACLGVGGLPAQNPPVATTPIVGGELGGDAPLIGAAENFVKSGYAEVSD